jgi:small subunit ribosomal protein S8
MMTDPIADLLTRMRNAQRSGKPSCKVPGSGMKVSILDVLAREGFIDGYQVHSDGPKSVIEVRFKCGPDGEQVIRSLDRFSTPGCRRYRRVSDLPRVRAGMGIAVVSTNQGILSDRECRQKQVGGEVLCIVE